MADILARMRARNHNNNGGLIFKSEVQQQPLETIVTEDTGAKLLTLEEDASVLDTSRCGARGGSFEKPIEIETKWYEFLSGGAREDAANTEAFLVNQIAKPSSSNTKSDTDAIQKQLDAMQSELSKIQDMIRMSSKNVENLPKPLLNTSFNATKDETYYRYKNEQLIKSEKALLETLKMEEAVARETADVEQSRFLKMKAYIDLVVSNAQQATTESRTSNTKLAALVESERKAQVTLAKYKDHARAVLERTKKLEASKPKSIAELHAYETEIANVLVQTMKVIEKLHEKIDTSLGEAKQLESIAKLKIKEAKVAQDSFAEYETIVKDALEKSSNAIKKVREQEEKLRTIKEANVERDGGRVTLREMQKPSLINYNQKNNEKEDVLSPSLFGGSTMFAKISEAMKTVRQRDGHSKESFHSLVAKEIEDTTKTSL